jgi:NAD(P)-dependent dehydrogenase (short-subunit alcohol dehydrogenase family)
MQNRFDLSGKTALITGASSGFGWHFSKVLADAGAKVVLGARRTDRLEQLCKEIKADGGSALPVELDVTKAQSIADAFDAAESSFGTVTILVNNAGISRAGLLLTLSEQDWDAVMDTNLKAVWSVGREAASRLSQAGVGGAIVNISSLLAFGTGKSLGSYMAAKSGVVHLTRAMALEWSALGVRVNALAPGYFPTEMTGNFFETAAGQQMTGRIPQKRVGNIDELSGPLLLLVSDASSYMTGSIVTVDGGHLCQQL